MRRSLALPFLALMLLGACETIQGFGQDVSTGGRVIQQEAAETQAGI